MYEVHKWIGSAKKSGGVKMKYRELAGIEALEYEEMSRVIGGAAPLREVTKEASAESIQSVGPPKQALLHMAPPAAERFYRMEGTPGGRPVQAKVLEKR
jgi:hypothetical protein